MLTAKEAAAVLGLKPRTIYDLAKAGKLTKHPGMQEWRDEGV